jgi:phosphatidylglycerophosphate synthase
MHWVGVQWVENVSWANLLTLSRILMIPIVFITLARGFYVSSLVLLTCGLLTDFLDGKTARYFNQVSALGSLLDPVADKAVVISFFSFLFSKGMVPLWFVILTLGRNIAQLISIPILGWMMNIPFKVNPKLIPKIATTLSFLLVWLLFLQFLPPGTLLSTSLATRLLSPIVGAMIGISAVLEIYVLATYVPRFFQIAKGTHDTF